MRKLLLSLIFFAVTVLQPKARAGTEKFQLTLLLSPTTEWMRFRNSVNAAAYNSLWGNKFSYNFGLEYKRFFDPSLSFSIGATYMNKGFRNSIYDASGAETVGTTLCSVHMAAVPLLLNFHHSLRRKVEMIYTAGIAGGYLISETVRSKSYTGEALPEQGWFDVNGGRSNVNLFQDHYIGLNLGIGISTYLKSRLVLIVQPTYKHQLNNARDFTGQFASGDYFTAGLHSFGVDFKLGYFFTKQFRNRKKEY